eukprot:Opistho-2@56334
MTMRCESADIARGLNDCLAPGALPSIDAFLAETGSDGQLENEAWVCSFRMRGLRVFQKKFTRPYVCWREHKRVVVPATTVLALLRDYSPARLRWDPSLLEVTVVETRDDGTRVVRYLYSSPSVHRSREFLVLEREVTMDKTVFVLMQSLREHKDVPTSARFVRATMIISGFAVTEDPADPNACFYTHLNQVDIKSLHLNSFDMQLEETLTSFRPRLFGIERAIAEQAKGQPSSPSGPVFSGSGRRMSEERKQSSIALARKVTKIRRMVGTTTENISEESAPQSNVPEAAEDSYVPFEMVMQDPICRVYFGRFLDTEFNGENLEFWSAVEDYKAAVATNDVEEIKLLAASILKRYVKTGAEMQVNISQSLRAEIETAVKAFVEKGQQVPAVDVFKKAQEAIFDLMHRDPYRRFIESDVYADLLEYLNDNGSNLFDRILEEFFAEIDSSADVISAGLGGVQIGQRTSIIGGDSLGLGLGGAAAIGNDASTSPNQVRKRVGSGATDTSPNMRRRMGSSTGGSSTGGGSGGGSPTQGRKRVSDASTGSVSSSTSSIAGQAAAAGAAPSASSSPAGNPGSSRPSSMVGKSSIVWVPTFGGDGAIICKKRGTGSMVCIREMKKMDVSADKVVAAALDTSAAGLARWLGKVVESRVVETVIKDTCVLHVTKKTPFPLHRGRDFSVIRLSRQDLDGVHYVLVRSIGYKQLPETDKYIRGKIAASGFMVLPDKNSPNKCFVTFLSQIDMRLPNFETKMHRREVAKTSVLNALQKHILSH